MSLPVTEDIPSIRFEKDNPRPVGFVDDVDENHLRVIGSAFRDLVEEVEAVKAGSDAVLRVRFCSVRYMPGLPFQLYAFHILAIDDEGAFLDEVESGEAINYALVANHSLEVQREVALLFLYQLVFRQQVVTRWASGEDQSELDALTAAADADSMREFKSRIRSGWRAAAQFVAELALSLGTPLEATYGVDALPTREDVVRRIPMLRAAYNEMDVAREAIDKIVAMVGGSDPRLSASGLSLADEDKVRGQMAAMHLRLWTSQTLRDAQVCGNGYLVTTSSLAIYNLKPELVEVGGNNQFFVDDGERTLVEEPVLHVKGIEQFNSPYGISMLEPVLAEYQTKRVFEDARRFAEEALTRTDATAEQRKHFTRILALAQRGLDQSDERLQRILEYPRSSWVPDARNDLYFAGQERM